MTSAQAVVNLLSADYRSDAGPVLVTGSPQLTEQVQAAGFEVTQVAADEPQLLCKASTPNWDGMIWHKPVLPYSVEQDGWQQILT